MHGCSSIKIRGLDATRAKWEAHWSNALSSQNIIWLATVANCTTIRLPFGYFTLGPAFCDKTPFAPIANVYAIAWPSLKALVARCSSHGIGVLLDFHALPGGANAEIHSGTSSGKAQLWEQKFNLDLSLRCIERVAREATNGSMNNIVGLQLCNEAERDAPGMYKFYDAALARIAAVDADLPVYISDAWNLDKALGYALGKNSVSGGSKTNPVVVDTHCYYTFSEKDRSRSPQELVEQVTTDSMLLSEPAGNVFENKGEENLSGVQHSTDPTQAQRPRTSASTAAHWTATRGAR